MSALGQTITVLASVLSGGAMGAIITWIVTDRRERRKNVREFRRKLGTIRSGFERIADVHIFELYDNTVSKLQGDVAALKEDFCCRSHQYRVLRRAADAFASIPRSEIEKGVAGGLGTEFETGRKRILEAIDEIEKAL
jgi:hypothetical protein